MKFKCPVTQQVRCPVNAYVAGEIDHRHPSAGDPLGWFEDPSPNVGEDASIIILGVSIAIWLQ